MVGGGNGKNGQHVIIVVEVGRKEIENALLKEEERPVLEMIMRNNLV